MSRRDSDRLLRAALGELAHEEKAAFDARLETDVELEADFARVRALKAALEDTSQPRFGEGFATRIMARIRRERAEHEAASLETVLARFFTRLAPVAAALALALFALNLLVLDAPDQSRWEAALGLEPIMLESAYSIGEGLYGG